MRAFSLGGAGLGIMLLAAAGIPIYYFDPFFLFLCTLLLSLTAASAYPCGLDYKWSAETDVFSFLMTTVVQGRIGGPGLQSALVSLGGLCSNTVSLSLRRPAAFLGRGGNVGGDCSGGAMRQPDRRQPLPGSARPRQSSTCGPARQHYR